MSVTQLVAGNGVYYGLTAGPSISSPAVTPQPVQISSDLGHATVLGPATLPIINTLAFANGHLYAGGNAGADVFVTKLDPSGNLVYSTYFGGSSYDSASAIAVDSAGNVFVTGTTFSTDFPISPAAYASKGQAFVFKLNPDGSLGYSTHFPVMASSIAVDSAGSAHISGPTTGGLPSTPGAYLHHASRRDRNEQVGLQGQDILLMLRSVQSTVRRRSRRRTRGATELAHSRRGR